MNLMLKRCFLFTFYILELMLKTIYSMNNVNCVLSGFWYYKAGASTPYKRWSKCTVEKVGGGSVFAET